MKNQRIYQILMITVFLLSLSSCSSDDSNNNQLSEELFIGEWLYVNQTLNGENLPFNEDCRGGDNGVDYEKFSANGDFKIFDFDKNGGTECIPEEDESFSGKWIKNNNETNLTIILDDQIVDGQLEPGITFDIEILIVNENELSYMIKIDYDEDGEIDELIVNFKKK